jgi:hypothetical protein
MKVAIYMKPKGWDEWKRVDPPLGEDDPTGSMSSEPPEGDRDVFMFGFYEGAPGVWRSKLGLDIETAHIRALASVELEQLSDLAEPYEVNIWRPSVGLLRIRFVLEQS